MTKEIKEFIEELIENNKKDYRNIDIWEDNDSFLGSEYHVKGYITVFYTDEDLKTLTPEELKEFKGLKYYYTTASIQTEKKEYDEYFAEEVELEEIEHQFKKVS